MQERNEITTEVALVLVASLFLGFILALKIEWPILSTDPFNFLIMFLLSLLMLAVFVSAQKFIAWCLDCKTKIKLLGLRQFWFKPEYRFHFNFPLWFVLPLILVFLTNGFLKWLAILDFDIEPKTTKVRRKYQELSENDVAKIAIAGPIAVLILGVIARAIGHAGAGFAGFSNFALLCVWLAFLALIPIGLGFKLLNSSRIVWFFSFVLSFFILLLMSLTSLFATVIIALLLAAIATISYYVLYEK